MSKSKEQEALDKILESCQDEMEVAIKRAFYDYLVFGKVMEGPSKELDDCPFCEIPCNQPHCPYTKEE